MVAARALAAAVVVVAAFVAVARADAVAEEAPKGPHGGAVVCSSTGDTHVNPFSGGGNFNIYSGEPFRAVEFLDAKNTDRNFVIHVVQKYGRWGRHSTNNDYAVRCGKDLIKILYSRRPKLPSVTVNGRAVDVYKLGKMELPSAPAEARSQWTLTKGAAKTAELVLNCGFTATGPTAAAYASGFKASFKWYNWNDKNAAKNAHGALHVEAAKSYAGKLGGACGYLPGNARPHKLNHLIKLDQSLFSTNAKDHAAAARAGTKVSDPKHLEKQVASCTKKLEAAIGMKVSQTQSWFKRIDRDVPKEMQNFIKGCSIDEYYGLPFTTDVVRDQVCTWVKAAKDTVVAELEKAKKLVGQKCARDAVDLVAMLTAYNTEKFELDKLCNKAPPKEMDKLPQFPPCEKKGTAKGTAHAAVKPGTAENHMEAEAPVPAPQPAPVAPAPAAAAPVPKPAPAKPAPAPAAPTPAPDAVAPEATAEPAPDAVGPVPEVDDGRPDDGPADSSSSDEEPPPPTPAPATVETAPTPTPTPTPKAAPAAAAPAAAKLSPCVCKFVKALAAARGLTTGDESTGSGCKCRLPLRSRPWVQHLLRPPTLRWNEPTSLTAPKKPCKKETPEDEKCVV